MASLSKRLSEEGCTYSSAHCRLQAESFVCPRCLFIRKGRTGKWRELGRGQRAESREQRLPVSVTELSGNHNLIEREPDSEPQELFICFVL